MSTEVMDCISSIENFDKPSTITDFENKFCDKK